MAKSDVAFIYDKIGRDFSRTRRSNWPFVIEYLKLISPGGSVLDLGCGNGRLNFDLPSEVDYTGVDISKVLIDEAKRLFPKRKFVFGDIFEFNSRKKYDAVFCIAVIHHMEVAEVRRLLRKVREYLSDDGFAVLSGWNLWNRRYWSNQLSSWKEKIWGWRHVTVPYQEMKRSCVAWTRRDLERMAEEAGFGTVECRFEEGKRWWKARNVVVYLRK